MNFFKIKDRTPSIQLNHASSRQKKAKKKVITLSISKRQKFVTAVVLLSLALFFSGNNQLGKYAFHIALTLAVFTDLFLLWSVYKDLRDNFILSIFILPFFYSFAFGVFYFLIPARLLFRIPATFLYALGLYSLFLSQNVFTVASIRTIALLSGARIVSFVITLLTFFFLLDSTFSLHMALPLMLGLVAFYTYLLVYQSIRTYALQKSEYPSIQVGVLGVTLCIVESAALLWFWPSSPTILSLFMAGFFYTLVGLSHMWYERRLFRGVLWEYVWVGVVVFCVLIGFTQWGK